MRALLFGMSLFAVLSAQIGFAADIDYKLSVVDVPEFGEHKDPKPFSIEVQDRVWVTPGIQEATDRDLALEDSAQPTTTFRIEAAPNESCHVSYVMDYSKWQVTAFPTHWIHQVLLPRTRETFRAVDLHNEALKANALNDFGYMF